MAFLGLPILKLNLSKTWAIQLQIDRCSWALTLANLRRIHPLTKMPIEATYWFVTVFPFHAGKFSWTGGGEWINFPYGRR